MSNLYNKYSPIGFDGVIGQEMSIKVLKTISNRANIPNGILLTGIHGVGKTLLARIFAQAINCENHNKPCNNCNSCEKIINKSNDIIEIDGATYTGVENIRKIIDTASYVPMDLKYKVYIIDEVHMLSRSAFDALLMTLQEPPKFVKFIFATTRPDKLPDTFLSRCLCIHLNRISEEDIYSFLQNITKAENQEMDREILETISEVCSGSVRRAMSLLELILILNEEKQFEEQKLKLDDVLDYLKVFSTDVCLEIFTFVLDGNPQKAIDRWRTLYKKGYDEKSFLHRFSNILTNLSLLKLNENIKEKEKYTKLMEKFDISFNLLIHFWEIIIGQTEAMYNGCGSLIETTIIMLSLVEEKTNVNSEIKKIFHKE